MMHHQARADTALLDELLLATSRTFALSIPVLPEPTRTEVTVAYLLFRIADTLEDATRWTPQRQRRELTELGRLLREPTEGAARKLAAGWVADPPLDNPNYMRLLAETPAVVAAFADLALDARESVGRHTLRTAERMADFVGRTGERGLELRDVEELRAYCYAVAGIVGEMLTELFLLGNEQLASVAPYLRERAARFGEALQLVNILKDAAFDALEGRRFLPGSSDRATVLALAREDLDEAGCYVRKLQEAGAARGVVAFTALPVLLAWATLDRVEREGPGAKLTRVEVMSLVHDLDRSLDEGRPAVSPA